MNVKKWKVAVDKIVRLENLNCEMKRLTTQLGVPQWGLRQLNKTGGNQQSIEMTDIILDKIYKRYRRDFELFGYARSPS